MGRRVPNVVLVGFCIVGVVRHVAANVAGKPLVASHAWLAAHATMKKGDSPLFSYPFLEIAGPI